MSNSIIRGTMLLTGATFLSKFLGMIYVIPFNELVGETGGVLFSFAYIPYNILVSISTVGVPLAVSKFVSKYNSLEDYQTGLRLFKAGMLSLLVTGFIAFLTLFFGSEYLAGLMLTMESGKEVGQITVEDITMVLKMVSFALIIIPAMSIVRGFFQGYQSMGPTAVSQVVEQIVRILFLLGGAFIVIKVLNGSVALAVGLATFAAFVGGLASCLVLWGYWKKRKKHIYKKVNEQTVTHDISSKELFKEVFSYAGPFVLVGLATPLYQMVDQFTFQRAMVAIGSGEIWEVAFSVINFYGHKLVIIPVTIATGLSLAVLPALTKSFTQRNELLVAKQINQAMQVILVLVVPAAAGLAVLSDVAYGSLFGLNHIELTSPLLAWYAPVSLLFAFFIISSSILQGINQQRFAVVSLSAGLLLKILFNIQFIYWFGSKGAIFGTALAVGTAVILNIWRVKTTIRFSFKETMKRFLLILIFTAIMALVIYLLKVLLGGILPYTTSRTAALIMLTLGVTIGGGVYLWLSYQSSLLERVLGDRVKVLERFIRKF